MTSPIAYVLVSCGLAAVHVVAGKLRFLRVVPRSRSISIAGGVSVAYVFVHLLPEISARRAEVERVDRSGEHPGARASPARNRRRPPPDRHVTTTGDLDAEMGPVLHTGVQMSSEEYATRAVGQFRRSRSEGGEWKYVPRSAGRGGS